MPLTPNQLTEIRQRVQASGASSNRTKIQINAVVNAMDAAFDATVQSAFFTTIEGAAPAQFTTAQKLQLAKFWMLTKARTL